MCAWHALSVPKYLFNANGMKNSLSQDVLKMEWVVCFEQVGLSGEVQIPKSGDPKAKGGCAKHGVDQFTLRRAQRSDTLVSFEESVQALGIEGARLEIDAPVVQAHRKIKKPSVNTSKVKIKEAAQVIFVKHHIVSKEIGVNRPFGQAFEDGLCAQVHLEGEFLQ